MAILDDVGRMPAENEEFRALRDRANVALGFTALRRGRRRRARLPRAGAAEEPAGEQGAARLRLGRRRAQGSASSRSCPGSSSPAATSATRPRSRRASPCPTPTSSSAPTARRSSATTSPSPPSTRREGAHGIDRRLAPEVDRALIERNPGDEMGWFWRLGDLPECRTRAICRRCWRSTSSRRRSRTTATCASSARNLDDWKTSSASSTTCSRPGARPSPTSCRRSRRAPATPASSSLQAPRRGRRRDRQGRAGRRRPRLRRRQGARPARRRRDAQQPPSRRPGRRRGPRPARAGPPRRGPAVLAARPRTRPTASGTLQKDLQRIDAALAEARRATPQLAAAQNDEPARFDRFGQRIAALDALLDVMIPRVAALSREQQRRGPGHRHRPAHPAAGAAGRVHDPGPVRGRPALRPRD